MVILRSISYHCFAPFSIIWSIHAKIKIMIKPKNEEIHQIWAWSKKHTHCKLLYSLLQIPHAAISKKTKQDWNEKKMCLNYVAEWDLVHLHAQNIFIKFNCLGSIANFEHKMKSSPSGHFSWRLTVNGMYGVTIRWRKLREQLYWSGVGWQMDQRLNSGRTRMRWAVRNIVKQTTFPTR